MVDIQTELARWRLPLSAAASVRASAACDREDVGIVAVVVAELEFRDVERPRG